jgi:DNA-binding response OmpR family regulator
MRHSILLVSRDDDLQIARSTFFQNAGYQTFHVDSVSGAVLLVGAERPEIALLCFTLSVDEQQSFIDRVRETNISLFVLCLRDANVQPSQLIDACERSFIKQPGMARMRVFSGELSKRET